MVGRGEVLERMTVIPAPQGAGSLEALRQGGALGGPRSGPVLVCPPHPRLGGSMDSAVLAELVWCLGRRRHPTLRFNYRGVGASQGAIALPPLPSTSPVDLSPLVDDAGAALAELLASTSARTVGVVGVSLGALVAARLAVCSAVVDRVLLVSPPVGVVRAIDDDRTRTLLAENGERLARIVVGQNDPWAPAEGVSERLCARGAIFVVEGGDHLFQRGLTEVARIAVDAFGGAVPDDDSLDLERAHHDDIELM
jgi:alpha/beta superfamily hydrolase